MTTRPTLFARLVPLAASLALPLFGCAETPALADRPKPVLETPPADRADALVERGRYLVDVGGCNDCHSPWVMTENGPGPDTSRLLSGHPADLEMPPPPAANGPWTGGVAVTNTAWSGPWGVSFTANLTPDDETGLGTWTSDTFIATIRNGRHMGRGRPLLPPMPYFNYAKMTDEDLEAVFAYLQSIPAVSNRVPEPRSPALAAAE